MATSFSSGKDLMFYNCNILACPRGEIVGLTDIPSSKHNIIVVRTFFLVSNIYFSRVHTLVIAKQLFLLHYTIASISRQYRRYGAVKY